MKLSLFCDSHFGINTSVKNEVLCLTHFVLGFAHHFLHAHHFYHLEIIFCFIKFFIRKGEIQTMAELKLDSSVRYLSGVGEKRALILANMGIFTIKDLLYHFPRAYQHRGKVGLLRNSYNGEVGAFVLTVSSQPHTAALKGRMTMTKLTAVDESGKCNITFFNQSYVSKVFNIGDTYRFWGKIQRKGNMISMASPSYEPWSEEKPLPEFYPIYPLSGSLTQKYMSKIISAALEILEKCGIKDILPESLAEEHSLLSPRNALRIIHDPGSYAMLELARKRFMWEELYSFAMAISLSKNKTKEARAPVFSPVDMEEFYSVFPFSPTNAQRRVIGETQADMTDKRGIGMSRLICGDVGSGKTMCAAAAMFMAVRNGYQAALMAPTEILAVQHYNDLGAVFAKLGIRCELLCGSSTASQKRIIKKGLKEHTIDCIIGTHALLTRDVEFKKPGLIITDEQHRFGVMQRASLGDKGKGSHILVMSATPIPRTLALIMYGDLALSYIDEMPPGRKKVSTFTVDESYRERMNGFIEKQAKEGRQTYIVCPAIEAEEDEGLVGLDFEPEKEKNLQKLKNATEYADTLRKCLPGLNISLMHGKMKPKEKDEVMQSFARGEIDVLVSTTVIEVGVNVPNATLMIVENAERFGLSQLHQLRGRVGRGAHKSWCILVSDAKGQNAVSRLEVMTQTNDGLEIAKKDLELRGPGDFLPDKEGSARQSGGFEFRIASLCDDTSHLESAFEYAQKTLEADPLLQRPENSGIKSLAESYFGIIGNTVN
ncbi:MAG: ATP-dependent DNA helicase RecG [Ruminococcaceae bacterium]|nr:ATP-dependent DNA helicase RecG [Oscillospiraceae bacterium]